MGFDAARKRNVDLVEAGIIDAMKVLRIALENAVPVARIQRAAGYAGRDAFRGTG